MEFVDNGSKLPIMSWCSPIEDGAMEQARNLANHPKAWRHVALMPDCHWGYGMPIGGVVAIKGAIIPNAVGVDIGCGMIAVSTNRHVDELAEIGFGPLLGRIREDVPVGFNKHKKQQDWAGFWNPPDIPVVRENLKNAARSLGTLGGGNHFIEVQKDEEGMVWLMIHSGSRNLGKQICDHYHKLAAKFCFEWGSAIPHEDLAFLPVSTKVGQEYLDAMAYALDFAQENRDRMMVKFNGQYPGYGLAQHKGYGTAQHRIALEDLGPSEIHRLSFAPLRRLAVQTGEEVGPTA